MIINIAVVKINVITHLGSLNIGKTILCKNNAKLEQSGLKRLEEAEGGHVH